MRGGWAPHIGNTALVPDTQGFRHRRNRYVGCDRDNARGRGVVAPRWIADAVAVETMDVTPGAYGNAMAAKSRVASRRLLVEMPQYLRESRQPLASLIFIAPPLVLYEAGVIYWAETASRNGADVWLRDCLDQIGVAPPYLLPLLTAIGLLAWHFLARASWRWTPGILCSMWVECLALAAALVMIAEVQGAVVQSITGEMRPVVSLQYPASWPHSTPEPIPLPSAESPDLNVRVGWAEPAGFTVPTVTAVHAPVNLPQITELEPAVDTAAPAAASSLLVAYLGAGIYEETLFRLLCLPLLWAVGWGLGMSRGWSLAVAMALTSCLFSAAHHWGPHGEPFSWYCFGFRTAAGLCFAGIFIFRGFGIAAGTHALYDILVVFV